MPTALQKRAIQIVKALEKKLPDPKCELYYKTPYQLLVSVVLSAQSTDVSVNKCMEPLYKTKPFTPQAVVKLGESKFRQKIKTIGLAPTKARNVVNLSKLLLEKYDGEVPRMREELEELPGVGRKTASVVLGELFGEPTIAVDTHVFRTTQRLGLHDESNANKCEERLLELIPAKFLPKAHHLFILHGRYTCKARKPECSICCLKKVCLFKGKA